MNGLPLQMIEAAPDEDIQILPEQARDEKAPEGGDFETAFHFKVDFASQLGDEEFAGKFFPPAVKNWSSDKMLKVWIHVDGNAATFDGKIRAHSQGHFVDIPVTVNSADFGTWQLLTIDMENLSVDELAVLNSVDNVYVFTSIAWVGASAYLEVFIAEISLAAKE